MFTKIVDGFDGSSVLDWVTEKGNWKPSDGQLVSSGQGAYAVASTPNSNYVYTVDMITSKVNGKKPAPDQAAQVLFRFQDPENYYAVLPSLNGEVVLRKIQNGTDYNGLASANIGIDPRVMHQYQVKVNGGQIDVLVDGELVIRYDDPNPIADGGIGVMNNGSAGAIDNVSIEANP